ncbi:MAG TPA: Tn3 family transposase [Ktedonobacteraceae bacterium]|nr:Tn3 family transposase [Ktedonobacteraceae bacterium]
MPNDERLLKKMSFQIPLYWMVDPAKRKRTRKGLLKTEQVHQLARDITYGNRGRFKAKSLEDINSSGNCTAIIIAAITYYQVKEISRVVKEHDPEKAGVDISLLAYISPIEWSNVILYGEYKLRYSPCGGYL